MISIIMPTSNNRQQCDDAIESIMNSTKENFELIVVESESTDGTIKMLGEKMKKYKNIRVFSVPKEGIVKALNFGIRQTKGDVYLTHDDVIFYKLYKFDWLKMLKEAAQKSDVGIATTIWAGGVSGPEYVNGMKWIGTWSMYIPRRVINTIGLLDENMKTGDDIDYTFRIAKAGLKMAVIPYWFDHHRGGKHMEDKGNFEELVKEMGEYFRRKHGI